MVSRLIKINARVIFWDFDGVIKDSVKVKTDAFEKLFSPFGQEVIETMREHHEENGGMSRFDKLPIYLEWAGKESSEQLVNDYSKEFSLIVKQNVINSEWVEGVLEYLKENYNRQQFFLVTATPQKEIEDILLSLGIRDYFHAIIGAPIAKKDAISHLLLEYSIVADRAVMIGDSRSDYEAAQFNNISFILRRTGLNKAFQNQLNCKMVYNFL